MKCGSGRSASLPPPKRSTSRPTGRSRNRIIRLSAIWADGSTEWTAHFRGGHGVLCCHAALAKGDRAEFVEFRVPTSLLADAPIAARVQHRDDFILGAASRLTELVSTRGGDLAAMASHGIVHALQLHLLERYGARLPAKGRRDLSASDRTRVAEAISSQLDARHSLAGLAALVGMDARRFSTAFRQAFGLSARPFAGRGAPDGGGREPG